MSLDVSQIYVHGARMVRATEPTELTAKSGEYNMAIKITGDGYYDGFTVTLFGLPLDEANRIYKALGDADEAAP